MNKNQLKIFLEKMSEAVLEAGELAKSMQGKVENIGKQIDPAKEGKIADVAAAKTVIDEQVQENLLKAATKCLDTKTVIVDGEEITPSLSLFPNKKGNITLVLDPIDGTLLYLNGKNNYRIVVGLIEKGKIISALIYYPVLDEMYFFDSNGHGRLAKKFSKTRFEKAVALRLTKSSTKKVFVNYSISGQIIRKLKKAGYQVVRDLDFDFPDWMMRFSELLRGEYVVLLFQSPQIRDILLGAIVATVKGIYVANWEGKPLVWPSGGRVPKIMFGVGRIPQEIIACIKNT